MRSLTWTVSLILLTPVPGQEPAPRTDLFGDPLPPGAVVRMGTLRLRHHDDSVFGLVFTPDGRKLISAGNDRTIRIWDANSGREMRRLLPPAGNQVHSLALSVDGKAVAVGGNAHICVWDVDSGKELRRVSVLPGAVRALAFSPDGKVLASGSWNKTIYLWRLATGEVMNTLAGHGAPITALAFSADGNTLASGSDDRTVCLWNMSAARESARLQQAASVSQVVFTPDGKGLITAADIRLWDIAKDTMLRDFNTTGAPALSPDGKTLAVGADALVLYDLASGKELRRTAKQEWPVAAVAFSPDGKTLASGSLDSRIRLWDARTMKERLPASGHGTAVGFVSFLSDGRSLISASQHYDLTCRTWDGLTGRQQHTFKVQTNPGTPDFRITGLTVTPDGKTTALACSDGIIRLVKTQSGEEIRRLQGHHGGVMAVTFSADGRLLASGGVDNTVRLWDVATGVEKHKLRGHAGYVPSVAFSPDSKVLASSGAALEPVRLWDVATGSRLRDFGEPRKMYHSVAFTPDGKYLAVSEWTGVTLWELATGRHFNHFAGPRADIKFSRDSRTLWAKAADESLGLWEVVTGSLRVRLQGHGAPIHAIALSPDGRRLASGSADTTILLWDATGRNGESRPGSALTAVQLQAFWKDLYQEDGQRAHAAILTLSSDPVRSVPFLREHIHPISAALARQLIADLDSTQFVLRDKAMRKLEGFGKSVEGALRAALAHAGSLEHRRRLELLMERCRKQVLSRQQIQSLRGIETLEMIGTPEARQALVELTKNAAAGTFEHNESRAALARLKSARD